jgi:hypothetical protein
MDLVTTTRRSSMSKKLTIAVLAVLLMAFGAAGAQAKKHRHPHKRHSVHLKADWRGKSEPAPAPAPAPGPAPAETGFHGHVLHYAQGSGFGGYLRIKDDATGAETTEFFGEKTDLECAPAAAGPYAPCDKSNLKDGTPVTRAAHAVNAYGHDVWTHVFLVVEKPSTEPPAPPAPPVPPAEPPAAYGNVFSFGEGVLTLVRANNGEHVSAGVGPATDFECGHSLAGPWTKCSADAVKAGGQVAKASHALVDGKQVWTSVYLVIAG